MKLAGPSLFVLLIVVVLLAGCVQVTINTPPVPGAATPAVTTVRTTIPADEMPVPAATPVTVNTAAAGTDSGSGFIIPVGDVTRRGYRSFTFNYAPAGIAREYTIRVPVNMSVLYGARNSQVTLPPSSEDPAAVKRYIDTFESDPAMEELYDSVLSQLRNVWYQDGDYLTDDQYMELIVAFVQQIPYIESSSSKRKYPVEVIYDKAGDSDEKSLLLANLLAREHYDVALLVFEDEGLEEVGIRIHEEIPDSNIKVFSNGRNDYVYVEAASSGLNFIGNTPSSLKTANNPGIYPVGNGTKGYGQINFNWMIVSDLNQMIKLKLESVQSLKDSLRVNSWDRIGTCKWIKNSKLLQNTTCYCCSM